MILPLHIKRGITVLASGWTALGFYRGVKEYNYENKIDMELYNSELIQYNIKKEKYADTTYTLTIPNNLFTAPICFMKEVYRIEINLRNISDEKNTKYYNTVY